MIDELRTASVRGVVVAGLGLALGMGGGIIPQQALAVAPSIDGTPSNPMVSIDDSREYHAGDTVTVDVSQTVGTNVRYSKFVIADVVDNGVIDIDKTPAHVYKIDRDGHKSEVRGAGTYSYNPDTKVLSFAFSDAYLKRMECDGETYVLEYTVRVNDEDAVTQASGGTAKVLLKVGSSSTIAVEGHDAYTKDAIARPMAIDASKGADIDDDGDASATNLLDTISEVMTDLFADHSTEYDMVSTSGDDDVDIAQIATAKSGIVRIAQIADESEPSSTEAEQQPADSTTKSDDKVTGETGGTKQSAPDGTTKTDGSEQSPTGSPDDSGTKQSESDGKQNGDSTSPTTPTTGEGEHKDDSTNPTTPSENGDDTAQTTTLAAEFAIDKKELNQGDTATGTLTISAKDFKDVVDDVSFELDTDVTAAGNIEVTGVKDKDGNAIDYTKDGTKGSGLKVSSATDQIIVAFTYKANTSADTAAGQKPNITATVKAGDKTVNVSGSPVQLSINAPAVNGSLTADNTNIPTGGTVTLTSKAVSTSGTVGKVTRTMVLDTKLDIGKLKITASDGGTVNGNTITWDGEDGNALKDHTVTVEVPDTAEASGKTIQASGKIKGESGDIPLTDLGAAITIQIESNSVAAQLKAEAASIDTGGTAKFDLSGKVSLGHANNAVVTATIEAPEGSTVTADGGKVTNEGTKHTITYPAASAKVNESLPSHTITVKIPDNADVSGKTIKATTSVSGDNFTTTNPTEETVKVGENAVSGTLTVDQTEIESGSTIKLSLNGKVDSGHASGATETVTITGPKSLEITADGGKVTSDGTTHTVTFTETGDAITTRTISVNVPDDTTATGASITATASISGANFATVDAGNVTIGVKQPQASGTATIDNATPSAGDTIKVTFTPTVENGTAHNAVLKVSVANADGAKISADKGKVDGNTVTFDAMTDATGSLGDYVVNVTLPDDAKLNGKVITMSAVLSANNMQQTNIGDAVTSTVQTPSMSVVTSATAVSKKATVDGTTASSDGTTQKADGSDASTSTGTDTMPSQDGGTTTETAGETAGETSGETGEGSANGNDKQASTDEAKASDGRGDSDTKPIATPDEKENSTLVINNGDEIEYITKVSQATEAAHANSVLTDISLDDYSAKNGAYIEKDTLAIKLGGNDVTNDAKIEWVGDDKDKPTGVKITLDRMIGTSDLIITYKASTGSANNYALRGHDIVCTAKVSGTNFESPEASTVTATIADAMVVPALSTDIDQAGIGQVVKYGAVIVNSDANSTSIAKNVYAAFAIDDYAASLGASLDPSTLRVLSVEDGKAEDITKNVQIAWDGTTRFSIDTGRSLHASKSASGYKLDMKKDDASRYAGIDHAIIVLYSMNTEGIPVDTIGGTDVINTLITRADNATYAVANKVVTITGIDYVAPDELAGGSIDDTAATADAIHRTGDRLPFLIGGVVVVIAAIVGIIIGTRKRHK